MNNIKIQHLELNFTGSGEVEGMAFESFYISLNAYMYKVTDDGNERFEVFERRKTPVCIDFEKRIYSETEFKEIYPKSRDFGVWAWTFSDKEKALNKFMEISALNS